MNLDAPRPGIGLPSDPDLTTKIGGAGINSPGSTPISVVPYMLQAGRPKNLLDEYSGLAVDRFRR